MTSAAEATLDAGIRSEIAVMRSRTSYPRRRLTVVREPSTPGGAAEVGRPAVPDPAPAAADSAPAVPVSAAARVANREAMPVRLTRRGRVVAGAIVLVAALTAVALLWLAVAGQARASNQTDHGTLGRTLTRVVVRPGQTLYGIATAADPTADPRVIVREIMDQNALASARIQVGQVLWVPRG